MMPFLSLQSCGIWHLPFMMDPNALNHDVIQAAGIDQEEIAALFKWTDRSTQDVTTHTLVQLPMWP